MGLGTYTVCYKDYYSDWATKQTYALKSYCSIQKVKPYDTMCNTGEHRHKGEQDPLADVSSEIKRPY